VKQLKEFFNKFLFELITLGLVSLFSILWVFHGQIIALENGRDSNRGNIELLRKDIDRLRDENREDHREIKDMLMKERSSR
jgi:hypothetical protein